MSIDRDIRKSIASLFHVNDSAEPKLAAFLKRAAERADLEAFRAIRDEYCSEKIARRLAKARKSDEVLESDRDEARIVILTTSRDLSDDEKRAYGAAKEAFSALCKKYGIKNPEPRGGAFNRDGERERPDLDSRGKAIIALPARERARRGENYILRKVEYALAMTTALKHSCSSGALERILRSEESLKRARELLLR